VRRRSGYLGSCAVRAPGSALYWRRGRHMTNWHMHEETCPLLSLQVVTVAVAVQIRIAGRLSSAAARDATAPRARALPEVLGTARIGPGINSHCPVRRKDLGCLKLSQRWSNTDRQYAELCVAVGEVAGHSASGQLARQGLTFNWWAIQGGQAFGVCTVLSLLGNAGCRRQRNLMLSCALAWWAGVAGLRSVWSTGESVHIYEVRCTTPDCW